MDTHWIQLCRDLSRIIEQRRWVEALEQMKRRRNKEKSDVSQTNISDSDKKQF